MASAVEIIEVGPRDGLQNQDASLSTADKTSMIGRQRSGYSTSHDLGKLNAIVPWLSERLRLEQVPAMVSRVALSPPGRTGTD